MNKVLTVALSKLLNIDTTVIEAELEKAEGDDSIIKDYQTKYKAYTPVELATLIDNAKRKYLEEVQVPDVPKATYHRFATAFLEPKEKAIAAKYGIDKYDNLEDLASKIQLTGGKGTPDDKLKQTVEALQEANKKLETEKIEGLKAAEVKYNQELINRDFSSAISVIPFDYEDDTDEAKSVLKKQKKLFNSAFNSEYKVELNNGTAIVLDSAGKQVVDHLGSPKKISDVMIDFATNYGFKIKTADAGGRGGAGSPPDSGVGSSLKGKTLGEAFAIRNVQGGTDESDKVTIEWQTANKQ